MGQGPWVLGPPGGGPRASGEGPRVVSGVFFGSRLERVEKLKIHIFLHNSALIPATELSSRLPGDTPSGFMLTGYDSDPRFLGGSYEG